ncbi:hypothetical protein [Streptomyces tanashiensis]|uniref:hypothetical protein n=1 Tax=Streptomyces tanashiensis TaxID=67367 RepID=UPI0033E6412F
MCAERLRAADHAGALAAAEAGLGLWGTGTDAVMDVEAVGAVPGDPLSALRAARRPAYRSLLRARAPCLARTGRRPEALAPLAQLVRE